jgi:threonylcarbamoyladenosine tRNA methylthiotransferase MtaB
MEATVCIRTVGCRTNQADSLEIRRSLLAAGARLTSSLKEADIVIINTCAVTSRAERDVRMQLGRARRLAPHAAIAVAGCMTAVAEPALWERLGVTRVFSNSQKKDIARWVVETAAGSLPAAGGGEPAIDVCRPAVKVQEGCGMRCTYCIVPRTRGAERSIAPGRVFETVRTLAEGGAREAVLTGTQLGSWGRDMDPPARIADLIRFLLDKKPALRLRLSSIEPWGIDGSLIGLMASRNPRLCPHLHIPLQSGSDRILERMGRPYTSSRYALIIDSLVKADPDLSIGTDLLTGFPGETDEDFMRTLDLVRALPLSYVHAFSFSRRPGTPAADLKDPVPARTIRERVNLLRGAGAEKRRLYLSRFLGKTVEVVAESPRGDGSITGTAAQFFRVIIPPPHASPELVGTTLAVVPFAVEGEHVLARPVPLAGADPRGQ